MRSLGIMLRFVPFALLGSGTAVAQSHEGAPVSARSADGAPPAPIIRQAPPGLEQLAAQDAAKEAPKPAAHWRSGLTLRAGLGFGSFIASESNTEQTSGTNTSLAVGGFPTRHIAVMVQLEYTNTDRYGIGNASDLEFAGLTADWFVTDHVVVGGGIGQTDTVLYTHQDASGLGIQGRFGYLVTQRRQHAIDLMGVVTTARFEKTQVTTINVGVGYRFL